MSEETSESKAPFNMAINTLERLGEILSRIRRLDEDPFFSRDTKQAIKTSLVIDFYVQSSPLLKDTIVKDNKDILNLKPNSRQVINSIGRKTNRQKEVFDWDLEKKLNEYLIKIEKELQKEGYFMPPKKDKGRAAAEF